MSGRKNISGKTGSFFAPIRARVFDAAGMLIAEFRSIL
jgi:hypothetical protein